jgi:starvation-inducible DNA-binding protein
MAIENPQLVEALKKLLGNEVVMYFKAHGHHWNVVGSDFSQFHDFFAEIYEDIYSAIDPTAEDIRKLGSPSPYRLVEFARSSDIQDAQVGQNAMAMCKDLYDANDTMLASLNMTFDIANQSNEQGIANFLSERIDMHKKWRWQLNAFLTSEETSDYGF